MPSLGSWARFFVGILLAVEVIRQWAVGNFLSIYASILAVVFLALSVLYFVFRF